MEYTSINMIFAPEVLNIVSEANCKSMSKLNDAMIKDLFLYGFPTPTNTQNNYNPGTDERRLMAIRVHSIIQFILKAITIQEGKTISDCKIDAEELAVLFEDCKQSELLQALEDLLMTHVMFKWAVDGAPQNVTKSMLQPYLLYHNMKILITGYNGIAD